MNLSCNEQTIAKPCRVSGRGYWSGERVNVVMLPAPADSGITLVRTDLPGSPRCAVVADHLREAQLRTNFRCGDATFQMVEHLLAALYGLGIDNCLVEIDAEELPGLDGSSIEYVTAIRNAGIAVQSSTKPTIAIDKTIRFERGNRWIEASPAKAGESYFEYRLGFDQPCPINAQTFGFDLTGASFVDQVARARTFVTAAQATVLRGQGVAAHVTNKDLLVFGDHGPIENSLRYPDECARHKTLDLIGDLAVTGKRLIGRFVSNRGGHALNGEMAKAIARQYGQTDSFVHGAETVSPLSEHQQANSRVA